MRIAITVDPSIPVPPTLVEAYEALYAEMIARGDTG